MLKDEWGTPLDIFIDLDKEFNFTLDPCGIHNRVLKDGLNTLDTRLGMNGLTHNWKGQSVFVNPPYSGKNIQEWIEKCYAEKDNAHSIVLLIPATKTGTNYFHQYIIPYADIRFVKGRINFVPLAGQNDNSNPLYSIICIFRKVKQ